MMTLRVTSRLVLLACCLCLTVVILLFRCGVNHLDQDDLRQYPALVPESSSSTCDKRHIRLLEQQKAEILSLKNRIKTLEVQLVNTNQGADENPDFYNDPSEQFDPLVPNSSRLDARSKGEVDLGKYLEETIKSAEITTGVEHSTEYDLIAFDRFTLHRIYLAHPGLGKRAVEKPIGYKRRELYEVLTKALEELNTNETVHYTAQHFLEGIYRTEPKLGTHYELFFINPTAPHLYRKIIFTRPFAPIKKIQSSTQDPNTLINLILPLSGRLDTFVKFMNYFVKNCIKGDKNVYLTVVYFGKKGLDFVKEKMDKVKSENKFASMKLVELNESFSRGRGLQAGVEAWKGDEVLLFLCDVDIVFTMDFLRRCRVHTELGKRVYYPVVFSLYNPKAVYSLLNTRIPHSDQQLVISKSTGFWRDFGYGMTCQYRSDFLRVGGFPTVTGWGLEDVLLYRKYVKSKYMVVRGPDSGIFHTWHEKICDKNLTSDQYRGCIQSKALNEAPQEYIGVLAFKEEFEYYKRMKKTKPTKVID